MTDFNSSRPSVLAAMSLAMALAACSPKGQMANEVASPTTSSKQDASAASEKARSASTPLASEQAAASSKPVKTSAGAYDEDAHVLPLKNPGFEEGLAGWRQLKGASMSSVKSEAAHQGKNGLRVEDTSDKAASSMVAASFPVEPGRAYRFSCYARRISGSGISVYLRFLDANGKYLNKWPDFIDQMQVDPEEWTKFTVEAIPPNGTVSVDVMVSSYGWSQVVADFDDFTLESYLPEIAPPWEPSYYFDLNDPAERARLTPADVPGPDGLVYPNWRRVGIPGGIPTTDELDRIAGPESFVEHAGKDIADLLQHAVDEAADNGGGLIELPAGDFLLSHTIVIRGSNTVLRGAGIDRTHLLFTGAIPYGTVRGWSWSETNKIGPNGFCELQANPKNLVRFTVTSGGKKVADEKLRKHWGGRYYVRMRGGALLSKLGPGRHTLTGEAIYKNGDSFTGTYEVELSAEYLPTDTWADQHAIIGIFGGGYISKKIPLSATAKRGQSIIPLSPGHGLKAGDWIMIEAPQSKRWNQMTGNETRWGAFRVNQYQVKSVTPEGITIPDALRLNFPIEDHSYVRKLAVVVNSGIEGLSIEQKVITTKLEGEKIPETGWYAMEDLWTDGIAIANATQCWVRDVAVTNAGRNPLYITRAKQCEIHDFEAKGALYLGGGGTGYVGMERAFDCLMDGATTEGMRHAPDVQWGASGNVIRNGLFIGSDGQWHAGWTNENLFENNVIEQTLEDMSKGTYGHGLFASGPRSLYHGPQGPRNVVYSNDVTAPLDGLHMVGGNEAWLVLYNRFRLGEGYAIYGKEKTFDHVIKGNVFIMKKPSSPAIYFGAPNCTGIQIIDNHFYGPVKAVAGFTGGIGKFDVVEGNTIAPYPKSEADVPGMPSAPVPSIFEWQRQNRPLASH